MRWASRAIADLMQGGMGIPCMDLGNSMGIPCMDLGNSMGIPCMHMGNSMGIPCMDLGNSTGYTRHTFACSWHRSCMRCTCVCTVMPMWYGVQSKSCPLVLPAVLLCCCPPVLLCSCAAVLLCCCAPVLLYSCAAVLLYSCTSSTSLPLSLLFILIPTLIPTLVLLSSPSSSPYQHWEADVPRIQLCQGVAHVVA